MKKHVKKVQKTRKPSKLDMITTATIQAYAHRDSDVAKNRNIMLTCEANVVDGEIAELAAKLSRSKARRSEIEAEISGLCIVVGARG